MRQVLLVLWALAVVAVFALAACGDAAKGPFEAAAALDRQQQASKAVGLYLEAHETAPETRYGKLALARAEVLLVEVGAQQLDADQWDQLDETAGKILELHADDGVGYLYKGYAANGKGRMDEAEALLKKASGDLRGIAPPSDLAVEATALALFSGASAGASAALSGSPVDSAFLTGKRDRLLKHIDRERQAAARRRELADEGTLDSMATLLSNYSDSEEAAKVRPLYAKQLGARLETPEKVGPPTPDDPDPIATIVDSLTLRAPEEPAAKAALAKVEALRPRWEKLYEEQIEQVDEQVAERQEQAMSKIAAIIRDKCAPARTRLQKGDQGAVEPLKAAAEEAAALVPNGMTEEDLQKIQLFIIANCTVSDGS